MKRLYFALTVTLSLAWQVVVAADFVELRTDSASCRVSLLGGRVVSFKSGGEEVLWNDDPVQLTAKDWAHGGIPFCWPWFGVDEKSGRIHGDVWRSRMTVVSKDETTTNAVLRLACSSGDGTVDYRVVLTDKLRLEVTVGNAGTNDFAFTAGFHPYFRVGERDRTTVTGVDGLPFEDDPSFPNPQKGVWHGAVALTNYVDRIFAVTSAVHACRLVDPLLRRDIVVRSENFRAYNLWNPGHEKNCPGVVPGDSWRRFVCVEPVSFGPDQTVRLAPGGRCTLAMEVEVSSVLH